MSDEPVKDDDVTTAETPFSVLRTALRMGRPLASDEWVEEQFLQLKDRMIAAMTLVVEHRDQQWDEALEKAIPKQKRIVRLALPGGTSH